MVGMTSSNSPDALGRADWRVQPCTNLSKQSARCFLLRSARPRYVSTVLSISESQEAVQHPAERVPPASWRTTKWVIRPAKARVKIRICILGPRWGTLTRDSDGVSICKLEFSPFLLVPHEHTRANLIVSCRTDESCSLMIPYTVLKCVYFYGLM